MNSAAFNVLIKISESYQRQIPSSGSLEINEIMVKIFNSGNILEKYKRWTRFLIKISLSNFIISSVIVPIHIGI